MKFKNNRNGQKYLQCEGFAISFQPNKNIITPDGDMGETALINEGAGGDSPTYLILKGNWCAGYAEVADKGYDACKAFYESLTEHRSKWSEDVPYKVTEEEAMKILLEIFEGDRKESVN